MLMLFQLEHLLTHYNQLAHILPIFLLRKFTEILEFFLDRPKQIAFLLILTIIADMNARITKKFLNIIHLYCSLISHTY